MAGKTYVQLKLLALRLALRSGRHSEVTVVILGRLRVRARQQLVLVHVQERERRARRIRVHAHRAFATVSLLSEAIFFNLYYR